MEAEINAFIDDNLEENGSDEAVSEVCAKIREKFRIQCDYTCAGGFDSPGYSIDGFVIAYVTEDGKLGLYAHDHVCC